MPRRRRPNRRVLAIGTVIAIAAGLSACDDGGSSKSDGTSTSTRKRRPTTTSSSTRVDGSSTSTTSTSSGSVTTATAPPPTSVPSGTGSCGAQAAAIAAAVNGGDLGPVPVANYTITDCRLAPSQPIWGAVTLVPKPGETVDRLTVVLQRLGSIWTVHSYNTGATGCDAPAPVPAELRVGC
jgi:hypothetical protein